MDHILVLPGVFLFFLFLFFTGNSNHINLFKHKKFVKEIKETVNAVKARYSPTQYSGGNISNLAIKNLPLTINDQLFLDVK